MALPGKRHSASRGQKKSCRALLKMNQEVIASAPAFTRRGLPEKHARQRFARNAGMIRPRRAQWAVHAVSGQGAWGARLNAATAVGWAIAIASLLGWRAPNAGCAASAMLSALPFLFRERR